MRTHGSTRPTRLTESRLRSIIREELSKSQPDTVHLAPAFINQNNEEAAEYGATHYIDFQVDDPTGEIFPLHVGQNVAQEFADFMYDTHGIVDVNDEDILIMFRRYATSTENVGRFASMRVQLRFYGPEWRVKYFYKIHNKALNLSPGGIKAIPEI